MRTILTRAAAIFAAAVALAATPTQSAQAQKALVYCPVGIDETGCTAIVNAISTRYLGGVDKGWDGTNGTVDLATVDVGRYSVFVVPSLADDSTESPYAKLRTAAIAQRLDNFLTGRIVLWSGTPDQGSASRTEKDALLVNFVAWADANYATVRGPGLVVLQDQSENSTSRYGWVAGLVGINVVADSAVSSYASVRTLDAAGGTLMSYAGGQFAFTNMASYGFYLPAGAAGISLSAVGQTGTSTGGQVVLITSPGGNTGTAVVRTDRDDYAPGDTVTITGTGWQAGETITITLHEDPLTHGDRTLAARADASGKWVNKDFVPEEHDVGVRFILTALGSSGVRAQTTFTDGKVTITGTVKSSASGNPVISGAIVTCTTSANGCKSTVSAITNASGVYSLLVDLDGNVITLTVTASATGFTSVNNPVSVPSNKDTVTSNFVLTPTVATTTTTVASNNNPSTYGQSVTFTATVTGTTNPQCGTVAFKDGATTLSTVTLSGSNVATYSTSTLAAGGHTITAVYTPAATSCNFATSTSTGLAQVVNKATLTVTADNKTRVYGDPNPVLTAMITGFVNGEVLATSGVTGSPSLTTTAITTSPVNTYPITAAVGTLAAANYQFTFVAGQLSVTARPVTIAPNSGQSKIYGDPDPTLTYTASPTLQAGDSFTGTLSRVAGENVGTFAITLGTLSAGTNYTLSLAVPTVTFAITPKAASVTPNAATKVYGLVDPALTGTLTGFLAADGVTATYSRTTGETVAGGPYAISAVLSPAGVLTNYTITYNTAVFAITPKAASVTPNAATKVYGLVDPALTGTLAGFLAADNVTATYSRTTGETVAGSPYTISAVLSPAGVLGNYTITSNTAVFTITLRPVTVTAKAGQSKLYGDADPGAFAFSITSGSLAFSDGFTGTLTRAPGENVGSYAILQGALALTSNYTLTYASSNFAITPKPLTISVVSVSQAFGAVPPLAFTVTYSAFAFLETPAVLAGTLTFSPLASTFTNTTFAGVYPIAASGLTSSNYSITFVPGTLTILDRTPPIVSLTTANPNPAPINTAITLTANVNDVTKGNSAITSACYTVDGGACVPMTGAFGSPNVNVSATIPASSVADVLEICVYGTDAGTPANTNGQMDCTLVARYDPSAGFVTGGGWVISPLGAYVPNPLLTGKATFGFQSKYQKGMTVPSGNTEFQFHAGGMNFKSSLCNWLVISGARAQYKGTGTINGSGNYSFLLTAIDGAVAGGGGTDKFRMKIWDTATGVVVYDNQMGTSDSGDPTTVISGGSIVIHAK